MATPTARDANTRTPAPAPARAPAGASPKPASAAPRPLGQQAANAQPIANAKPVARPATRNAAPPVSIAPSQRQVTAKAEAARPKQAQATAAKPSVAKAVVGKAAGVLKPLVARRRKIVLTGEHGLIAAGFAIAFASGAFGIYMNLQPGSLNDSSQSQYWSVFAQMARNRWISPVSVASADPSQPVAADNTDPVVTGTIPSRPLPQQTAPSNAATEEPSSLRPAVVASLDASVKPASLDGYFVRDVFDGMALIESRYGLTLVKPGAVLLGAGHVNSIEMQGGKWVVTTSKGTIPYARK